MIERVVWQPVFCEKAHFHVGLDRDFAIRMIGTKIPREKQVGMIQLANEDLKKWGIGWREPYIFYEDTAFVTEVHLGNGGKWLSSEGYARNALVSEEDSRKPVMYYAHNIHSIEDAHVLMRLFAKWVDYSEILTE